MVIDKIAHKDALLQIINETSFNGKSIEFMFELLQTIKQAEVKTIIEDRNIYENPSEDRI